MREVIFWFTIVLGLITGLLVLIELFFSRRRERRKRLCMMDPLDD